MIERVAGRSVERVTMRKRGIALAVAFAVLIGGLLIGTDVFESAAEPPAVTRPASPGARDREATSIAERSSSRNTVRWATDDRSAAVATMRTAFETEPHLRRWFDRALTQPAGGGLYYAARALNECVAFAAIKRSSRVPTMRSGTLEQQVASGDAIAREVVRCDGLGDERSRADLALALGSSAALDDPLQGAIQREQKARTPEGRSTFDEATAMTRQAIALGDPNLLGDALSRLNGVARGFDEFDFDDPNDYRGLVQIFVREARCNLGPDCSRDASAMAACQTGDCGPYVERIGNWANFTADERLFVVQAGADLAASARDGTLLARYRR